jgi:hypothetical protein
MRRGLRRPGNANLHARRAQIGRGNPTSHTGQFKPGDHQLFDHPSAKKEDTKDESKEHDLLVHATQVFIKKVLALPPPTYALSMKFADFLKTRNIHDNSSDDDVQKAVDSRMFGATLSLYLSNASTTSEDFRLAIEFIEMLGYDNKIIRPGKTYKQYITQKASERKIDLNPPPPSDENQPTPSEEHPDTSEPPPRVSTPPTSQPDDPNPGPDQAEAGTEDGSTTAQDGEDAPTEGEEVNPSPSRPSTPAQETNETGNTTTDSPLTPGELTDYERWSKFNQKYFWWTILERMAPEIFAPSRFIGSPPDGTTKQLNDQDLSRLTTDISRIRTYRQEIGEWSNGRTEKTEPHDVIRDNISKYANYLKIWIEARVPLTPHIDGQDTAAFAYHLHRLIVYVSAARDKHIAIPRI